MPFQQLTTNLHGGKIRHEILEGRKYLVAPLVMIVEGVFNGSNGALLYPEEELQKFPGSWDHKPISLYHPKAGSACKPETIEKQKVGIVLNTHYSRKKLRAEAWLDEERIDKLDSRIRDFLLSDRKMEVSTGLYTENEAKEGIFKGRKYQAIARNHRPDHLALLPDQLGACSVADGAGLLQLNQLPEDVQKALKKNGVANVEVRYLDFQSNSNGGDATMARTLSKRQQAALREDRINEIIENEAVKWDEDDRDLLESLSDDQLAKIEPVTNDPGRGARTQKVGRAPKPDSGQKASAAPEEDDDEVEEGVAPEEDAVEDETPAPKKGTKAAPAKAAPKGTPKTGQPKTTKNALPMTDDEYIKKAPPGIRSLISNALRQQQQQRVELIELILNNEANIFTEEQLEAKDVDELEGIARLAQAASPQAEELDHQFAPPTRGAYFGAATPMPAMNRMKIDPLPEPGLDFSKK